MNTQREIGFTILQVLSVASFAIPGVGAFVGAAIVGVGGLIRACFSPPSGKPQKLIDPKTLRQQLTNVLDETIARQNANTIMACYTDFHTLYTSAIWEDPDMPPPEYSKNEVKELTSKCNRYTEGASPLSIALQQLSDPKFGKYQISVLALGQGLWLNYKQLAMGLNNMDEPEIPSHNFREMINKLDEYQKALGEVHKAAEIEALKLLSDAKLTGAAWQKKKQELILKYFQGWDAVRVDTLRQYHTQKFEWQKLLMDRKS
jgi:hypothetical protein